MPVQIIRAVEDRYVDVELSAAQVAELSAAPTDLFDVRPTRTAGTYRLTAGGRIGRFDTPSLRVVVESKIPGVNLAAMIDPEAPLKVSGGPDGDVLTTVAARLGRLMITQKASGLRSGYVERREESAYLTGRLDVAAQVRDRGPPHGGRFHVERDAYTRDIPAHQYPKAVAARLLGRFPKLLDQAVSAYFDVDAATFDPSTYEILPVSLGPGEAEIIACARMLWEGSGLSSCPPDGRANLQMLDLHRIFELYVARDLSVQLPEFRVAAQKTISLAVADEDRHFRLTGAPDVTVMSGNRTLLTIDTKWKILDGRPGPHDTHQIIAYMHATRCPLGLLCYPGDRDARQEFDILGGGTLLIQRVNVVGSVEECQASFAALADALRSRLSALEVQAPQGGDGQRE